MIIVYTIWENFTNMVSIMLGTNIFYSGYSIIFAVIAIISGIIAVWEIKDTDRFKGFGGFFIGGMMLLLSSSMARCRVSNISCFISD